MTDTEVMRLRNLRCVALRARAYAKALDAPEMDRAIFGKSTIICWTIARIATGRLRAHPYLSYQKGPGKLRDLADRATAAVTSLYARHRGRGARLYGKELQGLIRAVDDARALTWSAELSDALGRSQLQLRRLHLDVVSRAMHESARQSARLQIAQDKTQVAAVQDIAVERTWPYLHLARATATGV